MCHNAHGEYHFTTTDEEFWKVNYTLYNETYEALRNGTFQNILLRKPPEITLFLGDPSTQQGGEKNALSGEDMGAERNVARRTLELGNPCIGVVAKVPLSV
jgi:hypothetical protein